MGIIKIFLHSNQTEVKLKQLKKSIVPQKNWAVQPV